MIYTLKILVGHYETLPTQIRRVTVTDRRKFGLLTQNSDITTWSSDALTAPNFALSSAIAVPIGSFDDFVQASALDVSFSVTDALASKASRNVDSEVPCFTLKRIILTPSQALQHIAEMKTGQFTAHKVALHIDFPRSMLRGLQSCQLLVALANTGVLMTGRAIGKDLAALDDDAFAQHTWDPLQTQANNGAVILHLGMSDQKFADFKIKYPAARSLSPALFNDYTIVHNYVDNFNTFANSIHCSSSQPFDAKHFHLKAPIKTNDVLLNFNCSASEEFPRTPFQMLLLSSVGNESVTASALSRVAGMRQITVTRPAPLLHEQAARGYGRDVWTCNPNYFAADNITCDCGCGAPDPDCLFSGSSVAGCDAEQPLCDHVVGFRGGLGNSLFLCDHVGSCSTFETSTLPLSVFLSTPCTSWKLAGAPELCRHYHHHHHHHHMLENFCILILYLS
jgi:hypothetical protein